MAETTVGDDVLVKSVEALIAEKSAVAAKEKRLIDDLNTALGKMGYRVVPAKGEAGPEKKRGRPPGKAAKSAGA
jgi:hypothetical protein